MPTKQVIVWRHDLQCRLGKKMAQAGHAAQAFLINKIKANLSPSENKTVVFLTPAELDFIQGNYRKVVLRVENESQLVTLYDEAKKLGLTVELIIDDGLTEFPVPTKTCLAIGPDDDEKVDQVTGENGPLGKLKLL